LRAPSSLRTHIALMGAVLFVIPQTFLACA